ncbi:hypothetical protein [Echinicola salinicaeni]|uniref:hypothetical protein n=1 Tax=Echinicola salinicaeni TaxID=2762757 RepID=UPI001644F8D2|nr:hypothetical protein [Echinicola salinicaeni]
MRKIAFMFFVGMLVSTSLLAQDEKKPTQAVFVEIGGAGLVYSFNYETRFDNRRVDSWGLRAGIGAYALSDESFLSIPVQITKIFGKSKHYFEVGAGATLINYKDKYNYSYTGTINNGDTDKYYEFILDMGETPSVMGTMNFGYRRIPDEEGFTWRVNLTPIFNSDGFWPLFAGVGFGYAF